MDEAIKTLIFAKKVYNDEELSRKINSTIKVLKNQNGKKYPEVIDILKNIRDVHTDKTVIPSLNKAIKKLEE